MTATPNDIMKQWQQRLQTVAAAEGKPNPLPIYGADGIGGKETITAVTTYQKSHGLDATGQLDDKTRASLNTVLKPHVTIPPAIIELGIETAIDAIIPPSPVKEVLIPMFNNIVHIVLGLLPGLPDDYSKISGSIETLAKDATNKASLATELRDAAKFARVLADEADKVADVLDPTGAAKPAPTV